MKIATPSTSTLCWVLMLSAVTLNALMLSADMLNAVIFNVVMLNVVIAECHYVGCHRTECRGARNLGQICDEIFRKKTNFFFNFLVNQLKLVLE